MVKGWTTKRKDKTMKAAWFESSTSTLFGVFNVLTLSGNSADAKTDARTAMASDMNTHIAQIKVSSVRKVKNPNFDVYSSIRSCVSNGQTWAFVKKV